MNSNEKSEQKTIELRHRVVAKKYSRKTAVSHRQPFQSNLKSFGRSNFRDYSEKVPLDLPSAALGEAIFTRAALSGHGDVQSLAMS
jgi:hypothetical protein